MTKIKYKEQKKNKQLTEYNENNDHWKCSKCAGLCLKGDKCQCY